MGMRERELIRADNAEQLNLPTNHFTGDHFTGNHFTGNHFATERAAPNGMALNVDTLGQVFTPPYIVTQMLSLRNNKGRVMEPSVGEGAFFSALENTAVGLEIDPALTSDDRVLNADFFAYPLHNKFATIIGNPPYVRYQDIRKSTKKLLPDLFDKRTNLYLFFINKCIAHLENKGELIFITPRDFIKATSARLLNTRLYDEGAITHFYDLGDSKIFADYSPNCAIWRWEKGRKSRKTQSGGDFRCRNGQIWFGDGTASILGDYFNVKVGAVSGADKLFTHKKGELSFVCSTTAKDGKTKRMIYNKEDAVLRQHKAALLNRKIRKFDESNWWQWGRGYYDKEGARIYVNCMTRHKKPFFVSKDTAYDGSVMALFPKTSMDLHLVAEQLNKIDWSKYGFACGGRLLFTQRSLFNAPLAISL